MAYGVGMLPLLNTVLFFLLFSSLGKPSIAVKKPYVVYLGSHSHGRDGVLIDHKKITDDQYDLLASVLGSKKKAKDVLFHSYTKSINGLAANLEEVEAQQLARHSDVVSVFPNKVRKLRGDIRLGEYLGIEDSQKRVTLNSLWEKTNFGHDVIIGVIDSGVRSEEANFNDEGYGPIPSKWKGICQNDTIPLDQGGVRCNKKLIGARYYQNGVLNHVKLMRHTNVTAWDEMLKYNFFTPHDNEGHGTLTISLAGSNPISGVYTGSERPAGTVKGTAPAARLAAYKVSYYHMPDEYNCFDADILAAFDGAIHDGVDVISISLGSDDLTDEAKDLTDAVSIGSFHALMQGIPTVACQGNIDNDMQYYKYQDNDVPWLTRVGASYMNKQYLAKLTLGNNKILVGASLYDANVKPLPEGKLFPLTNFQRIGNTGLEYYCSPRTFDPNLVKGKIVLCLKGDVKRTLQALKEAGGIGAIIGQWELGYPSLRFGALPLPNIEITHNETFPGIYHYSLNTSVEASFTHTVIRFGKPYVLDVSAPGPNKNNMEILKPDIVAPGLVFDITESRMTANGLDDNTFISGTSCSIPIAAGIVALLKLLHPDWSPSAIKSALMTTGKRVTKRIFRRMEGCMADVPDYRLVDSTPLDTGSGFIDPNAAADPGLVYDITVEEYLDFMCSQGFSSELIRKFALRSYSCPSKLPRVIDLNYPAIVVPDYNESINVTHKLKNVSTPGRYRVSLHMPPNMKVKVEPRVLDFATVGEEKAFTVTFTAMGAFNVSYESMTWKDGVHRVTNPLLLWAKGHQFLLPGDPSYTAQ